MAAHNVFDVLREGIVEGGVGTVGLREGKALVDGTPLESCRLDDGYGAVFFVNDNLRTGADLLKNGVGVAHQIGFGDVEDRHTV